MNSIYTWKANGSQSFDENVKPNMAFMEDFLDVSFRPLRAHFRRQLQFSTWHFIFLTKNIPNDFPCLDTLTDPNTRDVATLAGADAGIFLLGL